jgi:DNA-binding NarL/FixJ family response regulator
VPLRVVFAEDNYLVREGTTALLATAPDVEVVASVADSRDLLPTVAELHPDVVLTDIRMPPSYTTEGIDAARRIRADYPDVGVLVLSQHADGAYAAELLGGGAAGLGYLLKERVADVLELVRALAEVARGGSVLDPKVVEVLLAANARERSSPLTA